MNRRTLLASLSTLTFSTLGSMPSTRAASAGAQADRRPRIGVVFPRPPLNKPTLNVDGFRQGLAELGYIEGRTIDVEWRFADLDAQYGELVSELLKLGVDLLVTAGTPAALAAKRATSECPVVMASGGDPVSTGVVASLARPGGNITGLSSLAASLDAKRLSLLRELMPGIVRVAVLSNPSNQLSLVSTKALQESARRLQISLSILQVKEPGEFDRAFEFVLSAKSQALIELPDNFFATHQDRIVHFALENHLLTLHHRAEFVTAGGLMAYGANLPDLYRRSAMYIDKILKGARPADLPIEQPTRFDLIFNLRTARALGVSIPPTLRLQATELVQ